MSGVEILNTYEVENGSYLNWHSPYVGWTILSLISTIAFSFLLIWLFDEPIVGVFVGTAFIIPLLLGLKISEPIYETHYDVLVEDSVSINDFNEKYEIIEIKGKIFEVRERVE